MADKHIEEHRAAKERRRDRRLGFSCDATVLGIHGIQTITDMSYGGFYLQGDIPGNIETGQTKTVNLRLPSEKHVTRLRVKIIHKTFQGMGCQLTNQNGRERAALSKFFKLYNFYNDIDLKAFD